MIDGQGGTKLDTGKVRMDLFPGEALFAISQILTFGAQKYADRNWEKGIKWGRVFAALMRHMWAWWQGKGPTNSSFLFGSLDTETGFSHLWHAGCCIVFLIAYEMRGLIEYDDRPGYVAAGEYAVQAPQHGKVEAAGGNPRHQCDPAPQQEFTAAQIIPVDAWEPLVRMKRSD